MLRNHIKTYLILVLSSLRAWWKVALGFVALGTLLAYFLMVRFSTTTWEATGVMLYAPPPMAESAKGLYSPPDLNTILPLAKSPEVLSKIRDDFELTVPLSLLTKLYKITSPRGSQSVTVSIQWGDSEKASEMVDRLMERYAEAIRNYRQQKVRKYIEDYEARLQYCISRRKTSVESLDSLLRTNNVTDISAEQESIRNSIDRYQTCKTYALRDEAAYFAQRTHMVEELERFKKKDSEEFEANRQYDAEMESVSDARRRQDRLRELIEEERQKSVLQAELKVRRSEYDKISDLYIKGSASAKELENAKKDVDVVTAKLNDSKKIEGWKEELSKIDQTVVPKSRNKTGGSPIIQQALFRKLELDLKLTGIQQELDTAEAGILKSRSRLSELQDLERKTNSIRKEIESLDSEREKLSDHIGVFTRLRDQTSTEFSVISPATTAQSPVSSNRKLIFLGCTLASLVAGIACAVLLQSLLVGQQPLFRMDMTDITSLGSMDTDSLIQQRLVASQLRDSIPDYGAKILVAGDGSGADVLPWIIRISRRLAARDERILIIDCRIAETQDPHSTQLTGLGDYLHWSYDHFEPLLVNDDHAGVDLLPSGLIGEVDMLASHRMKGFIASTSERYSLIFLIGCTEFRADIYDLLQRYSQASIVIASHTVSASHVKLLKSQLRSIPLYSIQT